MIIAVINQKGGVAKSTSTVNIGVALALSGARVLLLDLDTQRDLLSYSDLVPGVTVASADHKSLPTHLKNGSPQDDYEHALLDCPPALNEESAAALKVAHVALVPLQAEYAALRGLARLMETIEVARSRYNPNLRLKILLTMYDARARHCAEVEAEVRKRFGAQVLTPVIRRSIAFAEASLSHQSILQFAPRSAGAQAYRAVAQQLIARPEGTPEIKLEQAQSQAKAPCLNPEQPKLQKLRKEKAS